MSAEHMHQSYRVLGEGMENLTLFSDAHPDQVIKFARHLHIWGKHKLNKKGHSGTRERITGNLDIIRAFIDSSFLPETRIRAMGDIWWTQQELLPVADFVTHEKAAASPALIPQVISVIDQAQHMYDTTGYYIDWFGFDRLDEMVKLLKMPGYWSLPNLVIDKKGQLKFFDLGLYRDHAPLWDRKHTTVSPFDPLVCRLQLYLVRKVKEKIGKLRECDT